MDDPETLIKWKIIETSKNLKALLSVFASDVRAM